MNKKFKLAPLFFIVFFGLFMFLGVETGESMFASDESSPQTIVSERKEVESQAQTDEEEPFILLIQVDDLTRLEPQLQGVWLMSSGEGLDHLLFFPLLPSQAEDGAERDRSLQSSFRLVDANQPDPRFFEQLSARNLAWSGYLLVDKAALHGLWGALGEVQTRADSDATDELISGWDGSLDRRDQIRREQAQFISAVCHGVSRLDPGQSLLGLFDDLSGHLYLEGLASLRLNQIWQPIIQGGHGGCQFPTLSP